LEGKSHEKRKELGKCAMYYSLTDGVYV
jgi:hypothetical protein